MDLDGFKKYFYSIDPGYCERNYQDIECIDFVGYSKSYQTWKDINDLIDWKDKTVIDVGCNCGYFCFKAEALGAECLGLDTNPHVIDLSKKIKSIIKSKSVFKIWKESDPLPTGDVTLCLNVLHYFKDQSAFLSKIVSPLSIFKINSQDLAIVEKYFNILQKKNSDFLDTYRLVILGEKK